MFLNFYSIRMHDKLKVWSELEYVLLFCKEHSDFVNYHLLILLCSFEYILRKTKFLYDLEKLESKSYPIQFSSVLQNDIMG